MPSPLKATPERNQQTSFFAPRFWPTWLGLAMLWPLHLLPYRLQVAIGGITGMLFMLINPYRRLIVKTNLALCFPQLDEQERRQLGHRSFKSLGVSLIEEGSSMWASDRFFSKRGQIQGLEHLRAAQQQGKGVLLLSGHFCSIDFAARLLLREYPVSFTYQELRNPLSNHFVKKKREQFAHHLIHRHDMRGFIRALKAGEVVWYAPDQSQKRENSVFAPFFGIPANTLTATTKLAKITGAAVMPFEIERLPHARGYALTIQPPLEDFPGESETADATRFNALIESQVRKNPDQYLWIHRRFKKRPGDEPKLYPQKPRRIKRMQRRRKKRAAQNRA
jgi:KDO2-lipid IV(A) lauroyltransferase